MSRSILAFGTRASGADGFGLGAAICKPGMTANKVAKRAENVVRYKDEAIK
ncbi:MAG: hypothetical protein KUG70_06230 [Rhodobacteraceae bacterium]|nr:hypothetical protein [Paracoccaceae bacterium]